MDIKIDFQAINECFQSALEEKRTFLYEYETYDILNNSGAESTPEVFFLPKGTRPSNEEFSIMQGEKVVLKIVSPTIIHKTEVNGVRIIPNHPGKIRSAIRRMIDEVPENYFNWINANRSIAPVGYQGLFGNELQSAISKDIKGVLLCQFMPPDSEAFGNELIVSIRYTREFGMVLTAGLGGTDTELYAQRFRKGQAVVSASTELTDGETFFKMFKKTIAYEKLAGISRGQNRIVSNDQLIECFTSFIEMANYYSPNNPEAPIVIQELEVNPFAFTDYQMVPLDGMCKFSLPSDLPVSRPINKIDNLLHPSSIAIIGVSEKKVNFGRIILNNIISYGFEKSNISIIREGVDEIDGIQCFNSLAELKQKVDLFIVVVGANQVPELVDQVIDLDIANSVILIPGGLGEKKGSEDRAEKLVQKINASHQSEDGGPVFLGGNCLGIVSKPGNFDTIFIPEEKLPKNRDGNQQNSAFISQSGAFLLSRTSKLANLDPAYMISIGNQTDLTAGDLVSFIKDLDHIDVIAVYMEGFNDMDGLAFCRAIRQAVLNGKEVLFYKAGRTPEGKDATSGHTASVAGDYMVCESCIRQAGAMVANSFTQFEDLYALADFIHKKELNGNRIAAVSGAGFEAVGMADSIQGDDFAIKLASYSTKTINNISEIIKSHRLDALVDVKNPIDINPAANDQLHADIAEVLATDENVDAVIIGLDPISPAMQTLPAGVRKNESLEADNSAANLMPALVEKITKPIIGVVDGGRLYDPYVEILEKKGMAVFRSADRAVTAFAIFAENRMYTNQLRVAQK